MRSRGSYKRATFLYIQSQLIFHVFAISGIPRVYLCVLFRKHFPVHHASKMRYRSLWVFHIFPNYISNTTIASCKVETCFYYYDL